MFSITLGVSRWRFSFSVQFPIYSFDRKTCSDNDANSIGLGMPFCIFEGGLVVHKQQTAAQYVYDRVFPPLSISLPLMQLQCCVIHHRKSPSHSALVHFIAIEHYLILRGRGWYNQSLFHWIRIQVTHKTTQTTGPLYCPLTGSRFPGC